MVTRIPMVTRSPMVTSIHMSHRISVHFIGTAATRLATIRTCRLARAVAAGGTEQLTQLRGAGQCSLLALATA